VGVRFHIQNVSNEDVQFRSMSGRQYWPTVKDSDGKEVKVDTWESLGTWSYLHHIIKPGQTLKLKNTGLIFSDFHDSALLDKPKWVGIAGVVRCGPGQYSIYYKLNRTLETGVRKVTVNERPPVNPRSFELTLDQQSMLQAIQTLRHKYRVRICFEQASSESGSKQHLLTGTFFAPTIPELLDKLTETSLYKWEKFYLTYAVYPKQNSLLRFSVNTDISENPLESVARVILDQEPKGEQIEIEAVYKGSMRRRLWISRASAMYALSGATARASISNSDVVWTLTLNQGVPRLYLHRLSQAPQTNEQIKADMPDGKNQLVWGEPIEGVQVRLRAEKDMWEAEEKPIFKADIRNRGELELYVHAADEFCQLEIDGVWYGWYGPWGLIGVKQSPLGPGNQINNISISLAKKWGGPRKALNLTAGMHTVRIAFILQRAEQNNQGLVRVVSNPVEIKILPAKTDMQAEAEGEGEKPMLVWGDQVNGLRAAVEFVPEKGSYEQGEVVGIRFHLQNVSNQIIKLATPRWWIQSRCFAEDQLGIKMPARTVPEPWGKTTIDRHKLLPGRVIKLESGSLAIAKDKIQRNSLCKYPVRNVVTLKPGRYSLYYWLRFPGITRLDGDGKVVVPQPDDWQGTLETGKRKLVITSNAESDQKTTVQVEGTGITAEKESEFSAILPNGVTVELIGMCEYPSADKQWWRPDGSLLVKPPYDESDLDILSFIEPNTIPIEFAFRLSGNLSEPAWEAKVKRDEQAFLWGTGRRAKDGEFLTDIKSIGMFVKSDQRTLDLRLGFSFADRQYEWVDFKNISVKPNFKPDVQVEGGEIEKTDSLVWGKEVNGLRAAVESTAGCYLPAN